MKPVALSAPAPFRRTATSSGGTNCPTELALYSLTERARSPFHAEPTQKLGAGRKELETAIQHFRKLAQVDPDSASNKRTLAVSLTALAVALDRLGKGAEALKATNEGLALSEKAHVSDPASATARAEYENAKRTHERLVPGHGRL